MADFPNLGNSVIQETELIAWVVRELKQRFGRGWKVVAHSDSHDTVVTIVAPDRAEVTIAVEPKTRASVRAVQQLEVRAKERPFLVAPYLSPRVRDACRAAGIGYADQTGSWRLRLDRPSVDWDREGARRNPEPESKGIGSFLGASTGRVLRALVEHEPPLTVTILAKLAEVTPATVSKVLALVSSEGLLSREARGAVTALDWRGVLERWAQDYRVEKQNAARRYLAPRGIAAALELLKTSPQRVVGRWTITGAWAAKRFADVLSNARLMIYVERPSAIASAIGLHEHRGSGANVVLLTPRDPRIVKEGTEDRGLTYAPLSLAALDLLGGRDREPSAGENLLTWMEANERAWRRRSPT